MPVLMGDRILYLGENTQAGRLRPVAVRQQFVVQLADACGHVRGQPVVRPNDGQTGVWHALMHGHDDATHCSCNGNVEQFAKTKNGHTLV